MRWLCLFLISLFMSDAWALDLKQSTAVTLQVGPFLDATDGVTPETALGLANDIEISKAGGEFATVSSASLTHDDEGFYRFDAGTGVSDTLGILVIKSVSSTVHVPVWHEFMVLPSNVWDSLYSTDKLQVDVTQVSGSAEDIATETNVDANETKIDALNDFDPTSETVDVGAISGDSTAADNLESAYDGGAYDVGTLDISELNQIVDDWINGGRLDLLIDAVSTHSAADVWTESGRALSTPNDYKADVSSLATTSGVTTLIASATGDILAVSDEFGSGGGASAASIADAVWDEATSGHVASGSFGDLVDWLRDVAEADIVMGTTTTPWERILYIKDTSTELIKKKLYTDTSTAIGDKNTAVMKELESAP